eukprot:8267803-Pyramimonas_sp.AAC.1
MRASASAKAETKHFRGLRSRAGRGQADAPQALDQVLELPALRPEGHSARQAELVHATGHVRGWGQ